MALAVVSSLLVVHELVNLANLGQLAESASRSRLFGGFSKRQLWIFTALKLGSGIAGITFAAVGAWSTPGWLIVGLMALAVPIGISLAGLLLSAVDSVTDCGCSVLHGRPSLARSSLYLLASAGSAYLAATDQLAAPDEFRNLAVAVSFGVCAVLSLQIANRHSPQTIWSYQ